MAFNFFLASFVYFYIPETSKPTLEEMDVLFGSANHVDMGANLVHIEEAGRGQCGDAKRAVDAIEPAGQHSTHELKV